MYITSSFLSRVELPLMTEVAVHCSGLSSRQNLLHVFNTAKFKKGLLIWMQTTVLMYSDWMVNRKKKTLWRLDVYCNNCFGMYSYRILVMIWDIISVGIFILCIFWDRKKKCMMDFFSGCNFRPHRITNDRLASCLRSLLPRCLHCLGRQVVSLFQHRIRQALDSYLEPWWLQAEKNISGCLYHIHNRSLLIVYLIKGLTYF